MKMTCLPLFATSCVMLAAHVSLLWGRWSALSHAFWAWPIIVAVYCVGPLTSMWNHGTASGAARWGDRCAMTVGLGMDVWLWCVYTRMEGAYAVGALTVLAVMGYACAKLGASHNKNNTLAHAMAHAFVTAAHVLLLHYIVVVS